MSFCPDCIKGVTHEGTPEGEIETIAGLECYVATPTADFPADKAVLFITDVLGLGHVNPQLLADDYARNGFKTYVPDLFFGDSVPASAFTSGSGVTFDLQEWLKGHGQDVTRPIIDKIIAELKARGVTSLAAVGYCFGGRYVFDLAFDHVIAVGATAHPSLLKVPEDLEKYASTATAPLLLNTCTNDTAFPIEAQAQADAIFADYKPGYRREFFEGCTHGFAVRGDLSNPQVKAGKEGAFRATVEWFKKHL